MKISVKVKPCAKQERLEKRGDKDFHIWVREKPQKGRVNQAVTEILAEFFGVSKSEVILLRGHTSREKVFEVKKL
jgi:uncharacterized protein YggU (UPF0235/DUF167 family)